mgnify:CR=1 FL=1
MREIDKQIIEQLNFLIDMGKKALASFHQLEVLYTDGDGSYCKDETLTRQWLTMNLSFLSNRLGPKSEHYLSFNSIATDFTKTERFGVATRNVQNLLGVLLAAKSDIESGILLKIEQLIRADTFADIHEQATYLLDNGYKDAAAVLFGAVLESALRRLCERQGLAIGLNEAIDLMNTKLASGTSQLYSKLVQKQITAWADIRNNAAHAHFDKYSEKDVEDMGKWINNFLQEHKP